MSPGVVAGSSRAARALAALITTLLCAVGGQVVSAPPAYAHAELVGSMPANGQRLGQAPREVVLRFTEQVSVVQGAFRLLDTATGEEVPAPAVSDESPDGATLRFALPADLPQGSYLVSWRVVSTDSHPVGGALSFGVGEDASPVSATSTRSGAPWPVTAARGAGYLALAMVAGALALAILCWRQGRSDPRLRQLRTAGIVLGVVASVLGLLLEGPYVAGVSMWRLFEPDVMVHVAHGRFGTWIHLRVLLYLLVGGVLWLPDALEVPTNRWLAGLSVVGLAATFPGTGHAAAAGNLVQPVTDALHALAASVWVGGLIALVMLSSARGSRPGRELFVRFSRLALASVLLLVVTGTVGAVLELRAWDDLWDSAYGQLLSVKLLLVGSVLVVAALSRRTVGAGGSPWRPVRYEAVGTVVVLAVTSALTVTAPPSRGVVDASAAVAAAEQTTVVLALGDGLRPGSRSTGSRRPGAGSGSPCRRAVDRKRCGR